MISVYTFVSYSYNKRSIRNFGNFNLKNERIKVVKKLNNNFNVRIWGIL